MSTAIEFGEVFANPLVRHSMELASSVWGATVCVIDKDLTAHFPTTAPRLLRGLLEALLRHPPHREELVQTYSPLLVFSPDWTGPRWYEPFPGVRQLLAPAGAGCARPFLLCIPFVHQAETEKDDLRALLPLARSLKPAELSRAVEFVPVLSAADRRRVQTHLSTLSREIELLLSKGSGGRAPSALRPPAPAPGLIGSSHEVLELRRRINELTGDERPLLLAGEVGTGKRTIARTLHGLSRRKSQPLVIIDCQGTPPHEVVATVLGSSWRPWREPTELQKVAGDGMVMFHEIACLPPVLQHFLLNLCDRHDKGDPSSFRLVMSTAYPLGSLRGGGLLRDELIHLLRGNLLEVPPLRTRWQDIPAIAADILSRLRSSTPDCPSHFTPEALRLLEAYDWPGNLWEMKGEVLQMAGRARPRPEIARRDVSPHIAARSLAQGPEAAAVVSTMPDAVEQLERNMIADALASTSWNRTKAAALLGVSRRNLIRKIAALKLKKE